MLLNRALGDSLERGEIRELHLRHIPVLKNCENWYEVKEIGFIDHHTKYAHYKGLIVKYGHRFYYLTEESMQALAPYRSWNTKTNLNVYEVEKKSKIKKY